VRRGVSAQTEVFRPSRCLHGASRVLLFGAVSAYVLSLALPSLHVLDFRDAAPQFETKFGIELLFSWCTPVGRSTVETLLWSLNAIAFATPLLLRIRPKRPLALLPLLLACAAAWRWSATPSGPETAAQTRLFWELDVGYFMWLGSLTGLVLATMLRWGSSVAAHAEWRARASAPTARLHVDLADVAHFTPAVRALVLDAARLRHHLDTNPHDPRITEALYEWISDLRRLPDADQAELERLQVPAREVQLATDALWEDMDTTGAEHLERVDAALGAFIATSTTGGRTAGFR